MKKGDKKLQPGYEDHKKLQQLLRWLYLLGGCMDKAAVCQLLSIGEDSYDKAIGELRELSQCSFLLEEEGNKGAKWIRYDYFSAYLNALVDLYTVKALKGKEKAGMTALLKLLQEGECSLQEIEQCAILSRIPEKNQNGETEYVAVEDNRTIKNTLTYFCRLGIAEKCGERPMKWRLKHYGLDTLAPVELQEVCDFVDYCANTAVFAAVGYLMLGRLQDFYYAAAGKERKAPFLYKSNYLTRVLDEYLCTELAWAAQAGSPLQIRYYEKKDGKQYAARRTGRNYDAKQDKDMQVMIPLRLVYDSQYGRWFCMAWDEQQQIVVLRLETIQQVELLDERAMTPEKLAEAQKTVDERLKKSLVIQCGGEECRVKIRFYCDTEKANRNFIRDRVERELRWGNIVGESEAWFDYEITVDGSYEIRPWIYSFGSSAEVLEPESLRETIISHWREVAAEHG